jgi:predicted ABC-type ATPase
MPQLWIVAGPNGAGKTTVADRWLASRIPVVSPDSIAIELGLSPIQAAKAAINLPAHSRRRLRAVMPANILNLAAVARNCALATEFERFHLRQLVTGHLVYRLWVFK